jgi:hypothetical protein
MLAVVVLVVHLRAVRVDMAVARRVQLVQQEPMQQLTQAVAVVVFGHQVAVEALEPVAQELSLFDI